MKKRLTSGLFLICSLFSLTGLSQSFPVQVIPQATPPPPIYLSDYADASTLNGPLRVQLILNDFEIANREIRLRAYFEGGNISFRSNDVVVGADQLFLEGGIPLVLTHTELAPYFRLENLSGISPTVYGQAIPEGAYQFCFEVYDVLTGNRLSQKSCVTTVVFQNEPPFLISPRNGTNVEEFNPQNIVFQWTPRHINVTNVDYELSIVEIWDTQVDPQQAFLSSVPVFQTTTSATTYVYGPADPLLLSGKNYAWRVQAKAKQGIEEIGLFENQGYSEIYSFSYSGGCDLPLGIEHEVKGSTNANIFWDDFSTDVPEYAIRYRKVDSQSSSADGNEWFLNKTTTNQTTLWDLTAGTTYEYQVSKTCAITESDWSPVERFTTFIADDEASVYECGITPDFGLTNQNPLPSIAPGETFVAGDFPIRILEVSGSNGRFTGKGYATIPYLNSIRVGVEFTNVLLNTDKQLAEGTVRTVYDPSLGNILDVDDAIDTVDDVTDLISEPFEGDNDLDEIRVNWEIDPERDIKIEDGIVVITNPANGATVSEPLGDDKVVVDSSGQVYHIDAGGNVTEGGQIDAGGAVTSNNVEGVSDDGQIDRLTAEGIVITFESTNGTFGFDNMPPSANADIGAEYRTIKDGNGNDYTLAHQAVGKGETIKLLAKVDQSGGRYNLSDIVFKTQQGETIPAEVTGNDTIELTLTGTYTFENETIYAVVPAQEEEGKQLTAGAFTLWHLTDRAVDVVLVGVGGATIPNGVESEVRAIFKKGAATLNLRTQALNANLDYDALLGGDSRLDIGESAWLTNYNTEQQEVISTIKANMDYDQNTYYLLVFGNEVRPSKNIGGFMPLQRQFGFIFNGDLSADEEGKGDLAKTVAHEIGHGVFALRHPFTQYGSARESTNWLMDYSDGSQLSHMDWAQMHNPDLKFYVFQDDEEGEIAGKIWIDPAWRPFSVPSDISRTIIAYDLGDGYKGAIPGFQTEDGREFRAKFSNGSFDGYYDGNQARFSPNYDNLGDWSQINLFEYRGCGDNRRYEFEYDINAKSLSEYRNAQPNAEVKRYEDACNTTTASNPFNASICSYFPETETPDESVIQFAVDKLNEAYSARQGQLGQEIREKGKFYHLVNTGQAAFDGRADAMEDKLYLLKQRTGINFYVIFQPIAAKLSPKARDNLAQAVLEQSSLPGDGQNIVIILPYLTTFDGILAVINCVQPGFAQNSTRILPSAQQGFRQAEGTFEFVLGAFSGLKKPLFVRRYFLKANGTMVNFEVETKNGSLLRGFPFINAIEYYESPALTEIRALQSEISSLPTTNIDTERELQLYLERRDENVNRLNELFITAEDDETEAFSNNDLEFWEPKIDIEIGKLREFYVESGDISNAFVATQNQSQYLENWRIHFGSSELRPEYLNDFDLWTVVDQTVYNGLDVIGLIPGVDTFTDAGGLVYAGMRGDMENSAIYSASLAFPFAGSAYLKGIKNGVKYADEAFVATAKKVNGTLEVKVKKLSDVDPDELQVTPVLTSDKEIADAIEKEIDQHLDLNSIERLLDNAPPIRSLQETLERFKSFDSPTNPISQKIESLGDLQDSFLNDFVIASDDVVEQIARNAELVDAWRAVGNYADLRTNTRFLEKISSYSDDLLKQLNDDLLNPKWTDELKAAFKERPDDVTDIWKKLKENPAEAWEISKTNPEWQQWSQREFFKDVTVLGKKFEEETVLNAFKNRSSQWYGSLRNKVSTDFGENLDDYDMFSQVQLKYAGDDYFVADQVFVKYDDFGSIEDLVVMENKLKITTALTTPQTNALKQSRYEVRSLNKSSEFNSSNELNQGDLLEFEGDIKWYKVYDSEAGDVITGIDKL